MQTENPILLSPEQIDRLFVLANRALKLKMVERPELRPGVDIADACFAILLQHAFHHGVLAIGYETYESTQEFAVDQQHRFDDLAMVGTKTGQQCLTIPVTKLALTTVTEILKRCRGVCKLERAPIPQLTTRNMTVSALWRELVWISTDDIGLWGAIGRHLLNAKQVVGRFQEVWLDELADLREQILSREDIIMPADAAEMWIENSLVRARVAGEYWHDLIRNMNPDLAHFLRRMVNETPAS